MINIIWGSFIVIGILYSFFNPSINMTDIMLLSSTSSLKLIFNILPLMCLWLGIMNIAKESGLLDILSKKITPILKVLFPEIPPNHEAFSYIASNIIMNMLGLGNAATPFGLKAMKSMQKLNKTKDTATRSMITFLIINTSSVTIIPTTVISLRILNGSSNPSEIVLASIITTFSSCLIGLIIDRIIYLFRRNK